MAVVSSSLYFYTDSQTMESYISITPPVFKILTSVAFPSSPTVQHSPVKTSICFQMGLKKLEIMHWDTTTPSSLSISIGLNRASHQVTITVVVCLLSRVFSIRVLIARACRLYVELCLLMRLTPSFVFLTISHLIHFTCHNSQKWLFNVQSRVSPIITWTRLLLECAMERDCCIK